MTTAEKNDALIARLDERSIAQGEAIRTILTNHLPHLTAGQEELNEKLDRVISRVTQINTALKTTTTTTTTPTT